MADTKSCPGSKSLKEPIPEYRKCPNCGNEVEIWTDEIKATCGKCGQKVFRELKPSCIEWCSHAKECVGAAIYDKYMQGLDKAPEGGEFTPIDLLRREHDRSLDQLSMLTKALAVELGPHNIRVNAIAPSLVKTDLNRQVWSNPEFQKLRISQTPLRRIAEPEDVVRAALYLASDLSSFVTGHIVATDGGVTL